MKISAKQRGREDREVGQRMLSLQKMENFCYSYHTEQTDDMLDKLLLILKEGSFSNLDRTDKENLLDYIEALEELLPAVDEINRYLVSLNGQIKTLQDRLNRRRLIASLNFT